MLVTCATVGVCETDANGTIFSYLVYTDYSAFLAENKVRVTEKAINAQHAAALANLDEVKAAALAHYAAKA